MPRAESEASQGGSPGATLERLTAKPRETWTAEDSARVFLACIGEYHGGSRGGELGRAVFDKDDDVAVAFVTAASNLRRVQVATDCPILSVCPFTASDEPTCRRNKRSTSAKAGWQCSVRHHWSGIRRAACYGIQQQSLFECKGMAGNIIHAIATTNAIVAGLMVIEATKVSRPRGLATSSSRQL